MSSSEKVIDLQPLLDTIAKISGDRIIPHLFDESEDEFKRFRVPVKERNEGDLKDTVIRRFIKDWLRRKDANIGVDVRWVQVAPGFAFHGDDGSVTPLVATLDICWWPKRQPTEMELLMQQQARSKSWRSKH